MAQTIWLQRPNSDVPWGFRLSGGIESQEPIKVQRVTVGSVAAKSLNNGDIIGRIGNSDTMSMSLAYCNELIKEAGNVLQLMVSKSNGPVSPSQSSGMQSFPTKLNEQLSSMNVNSHPSASPPYFSPTSPPGAPGYHPLANVQPPVPNHSPHGGSSPAFSPGRGGSSPHKIPPRTPEKPKIPDAVLNMAARGDPDKKPFTYAADMDEIKEHRDRVRRKNHGIPSYQNMLNLPQFDDKPKPRYQKPKTLLPEEPPAPAIPPGPGEGVFVHAQFNSPLQIYSDNAVEEAFQGQTGGVVTSAQKSQPSTPMQDITQSETYKMIHGLNKPKSRPYGSPTRVLPTANVPMRPPPQEDETKFTGLNQVGDIPSKAFHRLQSWTDQSQQEEMDNVPEIDTSSIRQKDATDNEVGGYAEASIRYMGKNIPSRSFRMLQNMTGGDQPLPSTPVAHRQRQARKREEQRSAAEQEKPHDNDIVDISYVGGNIPSRSFKMLQTMTGEPNASTPSPPPGHYQSPQGRTVKVVKLRSSQPPIHQSPDGATDF